MLEFKVIENLKPNKDLTSILKDFKYKVINLQIILIINCNLSLSCYLLYSTHFFSNSLKLQHLTFIFSGNFPLLYN